MRLRLHPDTALLAGAALLLALLLVIEVLPATAQPGGAAPADLPVQPQARVAALPLPALVDVALSRPLFNPDRRAPASEAAARQNLPRLAGIIRSGSDNLAIFEPGNDAKPIVAGTGGSVAGWDILDIQQQAVTLHRNGKTTTLSLSYANLPVVAKPVGPPPIILLHTKRTDPFLQP